MIDEDFDSRTLANMNVALDRVCAENPRGEDHLLRKRVARHIIKCARGGKTGLGDLVAAGRRALIDVAPQERQVQQRQRAGLPRS
jgi:hypothetical protein